jgi:predicted metal-dependent peptidase
MLSKEVKMTSVVTDKSELARTKIQNALARCMRKDVGISSILLRLPLVSDNSIETMCTDGKVIKYSDDFVLKITGAECEGVLLHEGYHVILLHHTRMGNRNHKLWNIACDYAINNYIYDHTDFELPEGGLWDEKYDHMTAEKIYHILDNDDDALQDAINQMKEENGDSDSEENDSGNSDGSDESERNDTGEYSSTDDSQQDAEDGTDKYDAIPVSQGEIIMPTGEDGEALSEQDIQEIESDVQRAMQLGDMMQRMSGDGTSGVSDRLTQIKEAQTNWVDILTDLLSTDISDDTTWSRPHRRYQWSGLNLPSKMREPRIKKIAIAVDTSCSVSQHELNYFGAEVQSICEQIGIDEVLVCYCDTTVRKNPETDEWWDRFDIASGETIDMKFRGRGGTEFDPVFNLLNDFTDDEDIDALIYFTDGECYVDEDLEPDIPVFWGITSKWVYRNESREREDIPFGELIYVDTSDAY